jgi:hypothetical protein
VGIVREGQREASMIRVAIAAGIVGLLLFVEPPLDGLAGYLLFQEGHRIVGTIVLAVNAVITAGVVLSFLPEWLHPPGLLLAAAIAHYNVNVLVGPRRARLCRGSTRMAARTRLARWCRTRRDWGSWGPREVIFWAVEVVRRATPEEGTR